MHEINSSFKNLAMSQNHPYRSFQIPANAPFELKPSPGQGWGAFATKRIEQGAIILKEKALCIIRKPHTHITEEDVQRKIHRLAPMERQQFLCLRDNGSQPFTYMSDAFAENSFSIVETASPGFNDTSVYGLFLLLSRFNHSCIPNSKIPITDSQIITSYATKNIEAGEEITFCYNTDFELRTRSDRHERLRFVCHCKACQQGTPFQQVSDMRRILLRGLQYLLLGEDLDGRKQTSGSPLLIDPKLKKAAEDFSIPLSTRLIANYMVMCLLEQEGLLDVFMLQRLTPGLLMTTRWFESVCNARVSILALRQETWLERFWVAFELWGREDIADESYTEILRISRMSS